MTSQHVETEALQRALDRLRGQQAPAQPVPGFRPATAEAEPEEDSRPNAIATGFRRAVPQGVRDAGGAVLRGAGRVVSEVDKPLTQRAGIDIPGPIGFVAEELTRPSTAAIAFGGAGLAAKLPALGRAGRIAAAFVRPVGGTSLGTRFAAEAALSAGARVAVDAANAVLPDTTPAPVRVAISLAAASAGGAGTFATTRSAVRHTLGKDLLAAIPARVKATNLSAEPGERPGALLRPRGAEQLGPDYTVKDTLDVANDLRQMTDSQANRLGGIADLAQSAFGKAVRRKDGNWVLRDVRDAQSQPALFQEVLEFPDRFPLSPVQKAAVEELAAIPRAVFEEGKLFGVEVKPTGLEMGQNFIPRRRKLERTGTVGPTGGERLGVTKQFARDFPDPAVAVRHGIVYEHPLVAIDQYARTGLGSAGDAHVLNLLAARGMTESDRIDNAFRAQVEAARARTRGLRETLIRRETRASSATVEARRASGIAELELDRKLRYGARLRDTEAARGATHVVPKREPPIVRYRIQAVAIEHELPPVPPGETRLWRGNRSGELGRNPSFTNDLPGIALPFREAYGGALSYVDVPTERLNIFARVGGAPGAEFMLPVDIASAAREVSEDLVQRTTRLPDGASLRDADARRGAAGDLTEVRADFAQALSEGRAVARLAGATDEVLRAAKRGLSAEERVLLDTMSRLEAKFAEADALAASTAAPRDVRAAARLASSIEKDLNRLTPRVERMAERVEALVDKQAILRDVDVAVREALGDAIKAERRIVATERALRVAQAELRLVERSSARTGREALAAGTREAKAELRTETTRATLEQAKESLADINARWREHLAEARKVPLGRARVAISLAPGLAGRDFPEQDAQRIARYYSRGVVPANQLGRVIRGVKATSRNIVPLRAMGDASATLNQLAAIAPSHPATFTKNFALAARDAWTPGSYERYLRTPEVEYAASRGVAILGRSADPTDFQFTSWFARLPGFHQAQRHFEAITTRNRVDIFTSLVETARRRGEPLSTLDEERIARTLNRASGIATSRAGDAETLALFAPNFLRSSLELVVSAAADGTLEGTLARQYLRNLVFAGQGMVLTSAYVNGQDPREVLNPLDPRALARGEIRMNSNFGTVRVLGQDVAVYGRYDSLARLAVVAADATVRAISEQDAKQIFDAIGFAASTKGAPLVSFGSALAQGATFSGEDPTSPLGLAEQVLPFTASQWLQDVRAGEGRYTPGLGTAFDFFGAKARELTPFERLQNTAQGLYGKPWDDLTGLEKQAIERQFPGLMRDFDRQNERFAARGDQKAQARIAFDAITADRLRFESEAVTAFRAGEINEKQFADSIEQSAFGAARERDRVTELLGIDFGKPTSGPNRALAAWYETYREAESAPNVVNWDLRDQLELELFRRIEAGEFGPAAEARRAIEERRETEHAPGTERYFEAKKVLSAAGYYDARDRVFGRFAGAAARMLGRTPTGYGDLNRAMNLAVRDGDVRMARQLAVLVNAIDAQVQREHTVMKARNPALAEALIATGRASATSQTGLRILSGR